MNTTSRPAAIADDETLRLRIAIRGAVQGVGFRPFVYRLATALGLSGWVNNSPQGVVVEVEGARPRLEEFLLRLDHDKPPRAFIQSLEPAFLDPAGYSAFEIRASDAGGGCSALILPDIATCPDCQREIFDPHERRYRYPFTNCTNCGPRFSIIAGLPYDRPNTTMKGFALCPRCRAEYENPLDRRFHAQPIACPLCGPRLELWNAAGDILAAEDPALRQAVAMLRQGAIVAVKGLGGFHLLVDARSASDVLRLRERKQREEKPFALMFPDLPLVQHECAVSPMEERLLRSAEAPIVLLRRLVRAAPRDSRLAPGVAPGSPYLGVMLPYTPLHHLLMAELNVPLVATSGNLSDEPICTDEAEALRRLNGIADLFLVHNRPIARHVDDSVAAVVLGREMLLRRARGYAPLPIRVRKPLPPLLATGAHLKNNVAVAVGQDLFVSQHIGDLETVRALEAFEAVVADLQRLYEVHPAAVACDAHPDYLSTRAAEQMGLPVVRVQHHLAHVLGCMAENDLDGPLLGVAWDGTGCGLDGTIWGGEFFQLEHQTARRVAHWRTFPLPGGEKAVREPWRSAIGLLYETSGAEAFAQGDLAPLQGASAQEIALIRQMLKRKVHTPRTSSVGRLFDAVAALLRLGWRSSFEGQAAMRLEWAIRGDAGGRLYDLALCDPGRADTPLILDWAPAVRGVVADIRSGVAEGEIAARFHNTLVEGLLEVVRRSGLEQVLLTGGCFQNRYLTERAVLRLRDEGFRPYWHQRIPPNDGGIALGQLVAAGTGIAL